MSSIFEKPLKDPIKVAAIIPAFQAEEGIREVLEEFHDLVDLVIVVDDGSTDQTQKIVEEFASDRVVLVQHQRNLGVGAAMKTGFRKVFETDCEIAVKVDADGQMKADDLPQLLRPILDNQADIAKGNRWGDRKALLAMPAIRRVGNLALSFLTRMASGQWEVFDPNNGYIAWRVEWLRSIDLEQIPDGFTFEAGMLVQAGLTRALVKDIHAAAVYGSMKSHLRIRRAFFQFPFYLFIASIRRIWNQYFLLDFNAVSLLLLAGFLLGGFGAVFGGYHWWISFQNGVPATAGTVVIAALPILLGFNCLLQALIIDVTNRPRRKFSKDLKPGKSPNSR